MSRRIEDFFGHYLARRSRTAAAELIDKNGPWVTFGTVTFRKPVSDSYGRKVFKKFCQDVANASGTHLTLAIAYGKQACGNLHFHLLIRPVERGRSILGDRAMERLWTFGKSEFDPPDDQKDSAFYLARREHEVWDLVGACPRWQQCRRSKGCEMSEFSWSSA